MTSLWLDRHDLPRAAPVADGATCEVTVVGGGLTGAPTVLAARHRTDEEAR